MHACNAACLCLKEHLGYTESERRSTTDSQSTLHLPLVLYLKDRFLIIVAEKKARLETPAQLQKIPKIYLILAQSPVCALRVSVSVRAASHEGHAVVPLHLSARILFQGCSCTLAGAGCRQAGPSKRECACTDARTAPHQNADPPLHLTSSPAHAHGRMGKGKAPSCRTSHPSAGSGPALAFLWDEN
jgi:hypothetical protein